MVDHCIHDPKEDCSVNLGVSWYKHTPLATKRFKAWRGFTVTFYLIWWQFHITIVSDYKAYRARMDFRFSNYIRESKKEK